MPHSRTLPTPSIPSPGNHATTYYGAATIATEASRVWSLLSRFSEYPRWTPSCQEKAVAEGESSRLRDDNQIAVGDPLPFNMIFPASPPSSLSFPWRTDTRMRASPHPESSSSTNMYSCMLTDFSPSTYTLAFTVTHTSASSHGPHLPKQAERVLHVSDFEDGNIEIRSYITVSGHLHGLWCARMGWNGHGGGAGSVGGVGGTKEGVEDGSNGGMDAAMRIFAEDVGREIARVMVFEKRGISADEDGEMDKMVREEVEREAIRIVNPERRDGQSWVDVDESDELSDSADD